MTTQTSGSLTKKIVIGMILGFVVGMLLNKLPTPWVQEYVLGGALTLGQHIFIKSLKVLVVPLVFISLVCGTASLEDVRRLERVGIKTFVLYLLTTAVAITLALFLAVVFQPGAGFNLHTDATFSIQETPSFMTTLIDIFPDNPIQAMADAKMLQIIVFSGLFGLALTLVGKPGQRILEIFNDLNTVVLKMVMMIMVIAPYGVFCLIAKVFAEQGLHAILPLAKYFFIVTCALFLHVFLTYGGLLKFAAKLSPQVFMKRFKQVPMFAFSTASSGATMPITLETVEHKLGVHNSIASFTIPLGATVNMDGTAIMQGVATAFIAQAYDVPIGWTGYLMVVVTATLASIGTAGVPGVGLITLSMVLRQVHLPVEGVALIIGADRLLDMLRTAVNVTGDAIVSCVVAKSENRLNEDIYYNRFG